MPRPMKAIPKSAAERPDNMRLTLSGHGLLSSNLKTPDAATPDDVDTMEVTHIAIQGVSFRSPVPLPPASIHHLRMASGEAKLASAVRVVSSRLRADGWFDIGAEFF